MRIETYSLNDNPFSSHFVIPFPFPKEERKFLEKALSSIDDSVLREQLKHPKEKILERAIDQKLSPSGYICSLNDPEKKCRLWQPDYGHEADFYNPQGKMSIEVEKTEVKRVVHDVLKLVNGSMTFVPKVRYGVLVIPYRYVRKSGKECPFFTIVRRELPFYFQKLIPEKCNLHDILIIVYHVK